jgi:Ca2+-binding RTX toxin-like protein
VDDPNATVSVTGPDDLDIPLTSNGDGTFSATVPAPANEGDYTVTATDGTNSATDTVTLTDDVAPAIEEFTVEPNSDGSATITVTVDDPNATVSVTGPDDLDIPLTSNGDGTFSATVPAPAAVGDYTAVAADQAQLPNSTSQIENLGLVVYPDNVDLDLEGLTEVFAQPADTQAELQVLGLLEGSVQPTFAQAQANGKNVTIDPNTLGSLDIHIDQVSLLSIAQAVQVYVFDQDGNIVHRAMTSDNPLVADVIGVSILGLTDSGGLSTTVSALESGNYYVLVVNDESALSQIAGELTLADLGQDGVILGADNQQLVLDTVAGALGSPLDAVVSPLLSPVLSLLNGLGVDQIVQPLVSILNSVGAVDLVDDVLDALTEALVNNTLTLLEATDITTQITEFSFTNDSVSGNVIADDQPIIGSQITDVTGAGSSSVDPGTGAITVNGQYGTLVMQPNGTYTYTVNLDADILGQSEVFTYTVSNNGLSESTTLTININDFESDTLTLELLNDTGFIADDGITTDGTFVLTGIEIGAVWDYSIDGGTTWLRGTDDRFTVPEGEYAEGDIQVRQTNWAGVVGPVEQSDTSVVVDQTLEFSVYGALDDVGGTKGHLYDKSITDDQTPTIYGIADKGTTIEIILDGAMQTVLTVDGTGQWQYASPTPVAAGEREWVIKATDVAGNVRSENLTLFVDGSNVAPNVAVSDGGLLGLLGGNVAGLIDLNQQRFIVGDVNEDMREVKVSFFSGAGLSLGGGTWTYSQALKDQFGYGISVATTGIPVIGQTTTITITAPTGSVFDNQEITEFLGTVRTTQSFLDLTIGSSLTVTATDQQNNSESEVVSELVNLSLLGGLLGGTTPSYLKEGTSGSDTGTTLDYSSSTSNVRIYGYDGDDTITGGSGNDILRGGNGNDTMNGGAGNDYLNGGAGNDIITGGPGADTVVFDLLDNANATGGNGTDTWTDFSLGQGDVIDVSDLLDDNVTGYNLGDYVSLDYNADAETVTVKIDRDAAGTTYNATDLLILTNQRQEITLEDLLKNQQILF